MLPVFFVGRVSLIFIMPVRTKRICSLPYLLFSLSSRLLSIITNFLIRCREYPMKNYILIFILIIAFSTSLFCQLNLVENFNYGVADNTDITLVGTGWVRHSGTRGPAYAATGFNYTGYPSSGIGGCLSFTKGSSGVNDGDVNKVFTTGIASTSDVYVSFLVNVSAAHATADYFFFLGPAKIATTFRGRIFGRSNGTGWSAGLSKSSETIINDATVLTLNQTYLFILKYSFNTTTASDDQVTLYIYDSGVPSSEPGSPIVTIGPTGNGTASDPTDIGCVAIREGSNTPTGFVDGIRVATSWLTLTGVQSIQSALSTNFKLSQNYPNPFNPSTTVSFSVAMQGWTTLKVYNFLGQQIVTAFEGNAEPNTSYSVKIDGAKLASGAYFYTLQSGNQRTIKKMLLLR